MCTRLLERNLLTSRFGVGLARVLVAAKPATRRGVGGSGFAQVATRLAATLTLNQVGLGVRQQKAVAVQPDQGDERSEREKSAESGHH